MDRQRVGKIVKEAASAASERLQARGLPPLPNTTPDTLRRTYISIALIANNFDVKWVMGEVGHADSKMTMDVYAHLEQRVKRDHGTNSTGSCAPRVTIWPRPLRLRTRQRRRGRHPPLRRSVHQPEATRS